MKKLKPFGVVPEIDNVGFTEVECIGDGAFCAVKKNGANDEWYVSMPVAIIEKIGVAPDQLFRLKLNKQIRSIKMEIVHPSLVMNYLEKTDAGEYEAVELDEEYLIETIVMLDGNYNLVLPKDYWNWLGVAPADKLWLFMWPDDLSEFRMYKDRRDLPRVERSPDSNPANDIVEARGWVLTHRKLLQISRKVPNGMGLDPDRDPFVYFKIKFDKPNEVFLFQISPLHPQLVSEVGEPKLMTLSGNRNQKKGIARFTKASQLQLPADVIDWLQLLGGDRFDYSYDNAAARLTIQHYSYSAKLAPFYDLPSIEDCCGRVN